MADMLLPPIAKGATPSKSMFPSQTFSAKLPVGRPMLPPPVLPVETTTSAVNTPSAGDALVSGQQIRDSMAEERMAVQQLQDLGAAPTPPTLEKLPAQPKFIPSENILGSAAPIMVLLAGLSAGKSRPAAITMLNAFATAEDARKKGDKDRYDTALTAWKEGAKTVAESNKEQLKAFDEAIKQYSNDKRTLQAQITALHTYNRDLGALANTDLRRDHERMQALKEATKKLETHINDMPLQMANQAAAQGLIGQALLDAAHINPTVQGLVKAMAEGRTRMPTGAQMKNNPDMAQAAELVQLYDPTSTESRLKGRNTLAGSSWAKNETAINSGIDHTASAFDLVDRLDDGVIVPVNKMVREGASAFTGDARYYELAFNLQKVGEELTKIYSGSQGTQKERDELQATLNTNMSKSQLKTVLGRALHLLDSVAHETNETAWNMTGSKDYDILHETANQRLNEMLGKAGFEREGQGKVSTSLKNLDKLPEGYKELPDGSVQGPDGMIYEKVHR